MEVAAEEVVHTTASATALGGQAPTGVGPALSLRASLPGAVQNGHHDATRSNARTHPTPSLSEINSEGSRNRWNSTIPQRREEAMQQPAQLVPHLVSTARPMPTLHPMAIFQPILSKLLTTNNHPMPLQVAIVRQSFVRINMRTNQFHSHFTPFHRRPITIQSILGILQVPIDHQLQTQYKLRPRRQMSRA